MKFPSLLLSPVSLLLVSCSLLRAAESRPNILYILSDDLGYGDLSCYGQQRVATPHLDRLAAEGMRFTQHYAGTTVCAPSRAAFLEGRHTGHTSVRGNQPPHLLDPKITTLPKALKQAGYATAIIGKWGLGHPPPPDDPARHGFDYAYGYVNMWHAHNFFPEFLYRNGQKVPLPGNVTDRTLGFNDMPEGTGVAKTKVTYAPHSFTRDALDYLDRDHRAPFFLYLALNLPHDNGEAFKATGDGNEVPDYGEFARRDWPQPDKGYARMVQLMDETVGQVLAKLAERGLTENTLVAFGSDNGGSKGSGRNFDFFQSNGALRGIKRDLYEGGIRVPLIVRWPGRIPAGRVSHHVNAMWDLYPTFCDAAGATPPAGLDGLSFLPTLLGRGTQKQHAYLYWEFYEQGGSQAVRQGQWKAVRRNIKTGTETFELFDLDADLAESRNLAAAQPAVAARLRTLMAEAHTPHAVLTFAPFPTRRQMSSLTSARFRFSLLTLAAVLPAPLFARSIKDLKYPHPLPVYISAVTTFGERPDWSRDGKRIVFVEKTVGDIFEVDLATRELTPLTHHYHHAGYTRALYLANGDILLSGARKFDATNPGPSRNEANAELWVLRPGSGKPPVALGAKCKEGPSVSRTQMQITWAVNQGLDVADIVYDADGTPRFAQRRTVLREADLPEPGTMIEAQDFRPGAEHELIINLYTKRDNTLSSTYGFDLRTKKLTDYSKLPDRYSEPEGIFPDGRHTLVESSRHAHNYKGQKNYTGIDLYALALDGSGAIERLTTFNDDPAFKASQGVISPDGRYLAFQISKTTDETGYGYGIMVMDVPASLAVRGLRLPGAR